MDRTRSLHPTPRSPRQIAIVLYPGVQSLDFTGPLEVFAGAQRLIASSGRHGRSRERGHQTEGYEAKEGYEVKLLSADGRPLETSSGLTVTPHARARRCAARDRHADRRRRLRRRRQAAADPALLDWISRTAASARRTASVCTGAFLLAARRAARRPRARPRTGPPRPSSPRATRRCDVDPEPIFVRDGPIWTSAGVTAGMDLALALVEEDLDREAALTVARHLVLFLRRPGNQSQFSATLAAQEPAREPLREVQRFVVENPAADLSVEALAARAHMSPRHFARAFAAETGVTPARYVERVRLEAARRALEDTARADRGRRRGLRLRHAGDDAPHVPARARGRARRVPPPLPRPPLHGLDSTAAERRRRRPTQTKETLTCTSRSCCSTAWPRSTPSGPTRC